MVKLVALVNVTYFNLELLLERFAFGNGQHECQEEIISNKMLLGHHWWPCIFSHQVQPPLVWVRLIHVCIMKICSVQLLFLKVRY